MSLLNPLFKALISPSKIHHRSYFLLKSEPEEYSFDMLEKDKVDTWSGIRNPVASKVLKTAKKGDLCFFYHSSCKVPAIIGIAEVSKEHFPDPAQFKPGKYFDARATEEKPRWVAVEVKLVRRLKREITLAELRGYQTTELKDMVLLNNSRMSCQHVTPAEWEFVLSLEDKPAPETGKGTSKKRPAAAAKVEETHPDEEGDGSLELEKKKRPAGGAKKRR